MQTIPANQLLAGLTLAEPVTIRAVVTDSRKVEPGCVFVCFPGERVDGHAFAAGAYRAAEFKEAIQLDEFGLDGDGFHMVTLS